MVSLPCYTQKVLPASSGPLHYIEAGEGPLLVLIHGSLCDYRYWRWQMAQFGASCHVVALSLPGCWPQAIGAEDVASGKAAEVYGMQEHVDAVIALCDAIAPQGPVRLLGHSRGAQVALEAALAISQRVDRLILADPGFAFSDEVPVPPVHAAIAQRLGNAALDDVLAEFVDTVNGAGTWRQTVGWFKDMVRANAWTLLPQLKDMTRCIDVAALSRLTSPVQLIGGEFSPPRYGERISRLAQTLPQAERVTVPRAAHGMNLANARYFNDAVLAFLKQG